LIVSISANMPDIPSVSVALVMCDSTLGQLFTYQQCD
jgi:hypothetical protein